jgi:hypothetical protein
MRWILAMLVLIGIDVCWAQIVPTLPTRRIQVQVNNEFYVAYFDWDDTTAVRDVNDTTVVRGQLLPQANLLFSETKPTVSINILKYYLSLSDDILIPFYILTSLPTVSEVSVDNTIASLLNEFGGLGNAAVGIENKRVRPFGLFKFSSEKHGLFLEARAGIKVVDIANPETNNSKIVGFGQALGSMRLNLPIWNKDKKTRGGDLTALLSASLQYSNASTYKNMFEDELSNILFNLNLSGALNITNQISLSGGLTLTSN